MKRLQTSATGICSNMSGRHPGRNGFTLLEILVLLVLLGAIAIITLPKLPSFQRTELSNSAHRFASLLRYLDERAICGRQFYRLKINLDEQRIYPVSRNSVGDELSPLDPYLQRNPLYKGIRINSVTTERLGIVKNGTVLIDYGAGGIPEPVSITIGVEGESSGFMLQAFPSGGQVRVSEIKRDGN